MLPNFNNYLEFEHGAAAKRCRQPLLSNFKLAQCSIVTAIRVLD